MARIIRYLMTTVHLPLILKINEHGVIEWWIDVSFAVRGDMKSCTRVYMSYSATSSQKQKRHSRKACTHARICKEKIRTTKAALLYSMRLLLLSEVSALLLTTIYEYVYLHSYTGFRT